MNGDVLVQLDNRQQTASTAKASAHQASAKANLEKLRNSARPKAFSSASAKLESAKAALPESEAAVLQVKNFVVEAWQIKQLWSKLRG